MPSTTLKRTPTRSGKTFNKRSTKGSTSSLDKKRVTRIKDKLNAAKEAKIEEKYNKLIVHYTKNDKKELVKAMFELLIEEGHESKVLKETIKINRLKEFGTMLSSQWFHSNKSEYETEDELSDISSGEGSESEVEDDADLSEASSPSAKPSEDPMTRARRKSEEAMSKTLSKFKTDMYKVVAKSNTDTRDTASVTGARWLMALVANFFSHVVHPLRFFEARGYQNTINSPEEADKWGIKDQYDEMDNSKKELVDARVQHRIAVYNVALAQSEHDKCVVLLKDIVGLDDSKKEEFEEKLEQLNQKLSSKKDAEVSAKSNLDIAAITAAAHATIWQQTLLNIAGFSHSPLIDKDSTLEKKDVVKSTITWAKELANIGEEHSIDEVRVAVVGKLKIEGAEVEVLSKNNETESLVSKLQLIEKQKDAAEPNLNPKSYKSLTASRKVTKKAVKAVVNSSADVSSAISKLSVSASASTSVEVELEEDSRRVSGSKGGRSEPPVDLEAAMRSRRKFIHVSEDVEPSSYASHSRDEDGELESFAAAPAAAAPPAPAPTAASRVSFARKEDFDREGGKKPSVAKLADKFGGSASVSRRRSVSSSASEGEGDSASVCAAAASPAAASPVAKPAKTDMIGPRDPKTGLVTLTTESGDAEVTMTSDEYQAFSDKVARMSRVNPGVAEKIVSSYKTGATVMPSVGPKIIDGLKKVEKPKATDKKPKLAGSSNPMMDAIRATTLRHTTYTPSSDSESGSDTRNAPAKSRSSKSRSSSSTSRRTTSGRTKTKR